jgi:ABC-2 type transport system permease protein
MNSAILNILKLPKKSIEGLLGKNDKPFVKIPAGPFGSMVQKEITDYVRNWRFIILFGIVLLTCFGSVYTSLSGFFKPNEMKLSDDGFFFLNLFTQSDGTMPPFFVFISFLGPLLGISLGFDAINSEQNKGTLSRILAQPIPRDYILNAKYIAGLVVISIMFFALSFMVIGAGLVAIGIPPTAEEFMRIMAFTLISILYVSFWLNLSILFSVKFKQPATSALAGIAIWLFFTVFYPLIVNLITKGFTPSRYASLKAIYLYEKMKFGLVQIMPNELFSEITSSILRPSIRSIGPLMSVQMDGTIPGPLPFGQSLMIVWPQLTGIIALTLLCFIFSYFAFMRREIRSR